MQLEEYFIKNKKDSIKRVMEIYSALSQKVNNYIDSNHPILEGKIDLYNNIFLKNKNLSNDMKEINNVLEDFSKMFQRAVIWENPGTMVNITPPANIVSIVSSFYASMFNPNFAQDESSGYLMTTELLVSKYLAQLVGWDWKKSRGIFTFGGKGTNLYAVKIGLKKAFPDIIEKGLDGRKAVVISNEKAHPCHKEVCDWLGLGKNSCIKLPVTEIGQVNIEKLEECIRNNIEKKVKIGCIILNGGTTNEIIIDPIKDVVDLRNRLIKEYNLDYIPHIHVDAVIGWAWLFFSKYDFLMNKLDMSNNELKKINSLLNKISQIFNADSFGADFHKTGFCPYISSIYMDCDFNSIMGLGKKIDDGIENMSFGEYSPFEYSLELSRSSIGPVSAYIALEIFGYSGFQQLIYKIFSNGEYIRSFLNNFDNFEVINIDTEGIATLFVIKPKKDNIKYCDLIKLSQKKIKLFLNFNYQFYLFCLKKFEKKQVKFKITFSKSYKPYGSNMITGALKIYPTSPLINKREIESCLIEIVNLKYEFDSFNKELKEFRKVPDDFVYRN
jgi:glutamate/tyrosine decarboxylase-like PLP-dependent enzyme